jgi:glycosyltransferase involved in cell wall biosynthesis
MKKHVVIDARESGTSTGRYLDKLVENLHDLRPNYRITLLAKKKRVEHFEKTTPKFTTKVTRFKEFTFSEQLGYLWQIRKEKADLVFFPAAHQPILYFGKVVTTIQDLTTARFRNPSKNRIIFSIKQRVYIWLNKIVGKKSTKLITPTEFVKEDFARFGNINMRDITVTHEAADKIEDAAEPVEELEDKDFIMYVGRPQPHKNLDRLVDAFQKLQENNPELRLVFVGKKDLLYQRLRLLVKKRGLENVLFTGFVSEGQLRWLYEHTKVYVFPSLSEGFGLPGLEAMVHGAPVASSNATCLPEVYQDGALYFDPKNTDEMAETIQKLLTSQKLRESQVAKGRTVAKSYSWRRMAEQTLAVFDEALNS